MTGRILGLLALVWLCSIGAAEARKAPPLSAVERQIAEIAAKSDCASYYWPGRGRAPVGYIKGMALTYAKALCEVNRNADTAAAVMNQPFGSVADDALSSSFFGESGNSRTAHLRSAYAVAIGLGIRQSSGDTTVGRDRRVSSPTAETAEAGLFQTNYQSLGRNPWLGKLLAEYSASPEACRLSVFRQGAPDKRARIVGTGPGADYQAKIKACPALAAESAVVMLRVSRSYFGPINDHQVELRPECDAMFRAVEAVVQCPAQ